MDCLYCLDCINSCVWGNFVSTIVSTILMIIGLIGGITGGTIGGITGVLIGDIIAGGTIGGIAGVLICTAIGSIVGVPIGIGGITGVLIGDIIAGVPIVGICTGIGGISSLPLNYLAGYIIDSLFLPFTSFCESFWHNLIWICWGPAAVRAAYMEGCMEEFLKACEELIRHLLGMGDE